MTEGKPIQPYFDDIVKNALREKEVDEPCPRCGNSSFFFIEVGSTHMLTIFCKRCGFKLEHLLSVLLEKTEE